MIRSVRTLRAAMLAACLTAAPAAAQTTPRAASADALLERLVGEWWVRGVVGRNPVEYRMTGTRVLGARYVELHMIDVSNPPAYEAQVYIGADTIPGRVLVHWIDNTGAAFSVPHGSGTVRGDTLRFEFAYSDGPFRDTFTWRGANAGWHFVLESGTAAGSWKPFADYDVISARPR